MYQKNPPKKLLLELKKLKGKKTIITFHSLGDLDALCAALTLQIELGKNCIVAAQDRVNSQCKRVIEPSLLKKVQKFSEVVEKNKNSKVILLDCNEKTLVPKMKKDRTHILIDHHAKTKDSVKGQIEWIDPKSSAVCQMLSKLIKHPDELQTKLLLFGILSDSANFANSNPDTFLQVSKLLKVSDLEFSQIQNMLHIPKNIQSRMNILEGLRNIYFTNRGGLICVLAQVPSHESHVADILVRSGADCAFVATASKKSAAISARMRMEHTTNVDLPRIMTEAGRFLGGSGGGHPAAAGASGKLAYKCEDALNLCQELFFEHSLARIKV